MRSDLQNRARQAIGLLDLTSLEAKDDLAKIEKLSARAMTKQGPVAALCLWPRFVAFAKRELKGAPVALAAVANFPHGAALIEPLRAEIAMIASSGADEIDLVFPYNAWVNGERRLAIDLLAMARRESGPLRLKVILETGALRDPAMIREASLAAIGEGADFIKTSTGKSAISATIEAARIMLLAIREQGGGCGFKAAGGLRDPIRLLAYLDLADKIMGADWISPAHFRFGASSVLDPLIALADGALSGEGAAHGY